MVLVVLLGCYERLDQEAFDRELAETRAKIEADAAAERAKAKRAADLSVEHPTSKSSLPGPVEVAPEAPVSLTPAELAAAQDLAAEFGKNAVALGQGTLDELQLTTKVAQRHKVTVEELDRIYAIAMVQHSAEIMSALNEH